jgi:hypothetical protein
MIFLFVIIIPFIFNFYLTSIYAISLQAIGILFYSIYKILPQKFRKFTNTISCKLGFLGGKNEDVLFDSIGSGFIISGLISLIPTLQQFIYSLVDC